MHDLKEPLLRSLAIVNQFSEEINSGGLSLKEAERRVMEHAWKRCPHLLRLPPLSKAPPEGMHPARRVEYGRASSTWARLIAKIYGADPLVCPRCVNSMRVLAIITELSQIDRIFRHLIKIGRAPPGLLLAPRH